MADDGVRDDDWLRALGINDRLHSRRGVSGSMQGQRFTMSWKDETANMQPASTLHSFQQGVGDECGLCNGNRFNPHHFNGDAKLAGIAAARHLKMVQEREAWQDALHAGSYVQVRDEHPREELRGRTGTIQGDPFMGSTSMMSRGRGTEQKMASVKFAPPHVQTLTLPVRMLQPSVRFTEVPRFSSQEEAEKWLDDTAKEMGVSYEPEVPHFTDPAEADEWMRRKAGDPYVPLSFADMTNQIVMDQMAASDKKVNERIFKLLTQAIPPASAPASWTKTNPLTAMEIQQVVEQLKAGEAPTINVTTLFCPVPSCGYAATSLTGSKIEHKEWTDTMGVLTVKHHVA